MSVLSNFLASFAILFVSILIVYICYLEFFAFKFPKNLPLVGFRNEIFGRTRASLRQLYRSPEIAAEGYRKVVLNACWKDLGLTKLAVWSEWTSLCYSTHELPTAGHAPSSTCQVASWTT